MSDEFSNYLLSGKSHAKLSPESLEMMGKQAANLLLDKGISLNDGIAKLAGEHDDISAEQVKRIVEFANTAVYLAKHDQNKTAGAEHSYPQFELADAGRIIQDLSDGARPTVVTQTDIDYSRQSSKSKVASAQTESALERLFKVASVEKDYSQESVVNEVLAAKDTLTSLHHNISDRYNQHESLFKESTVEFYDTVKRHVLDGGSIADVHVAMKSIGIEDPIPYMEPVVSGLIREKAASAADLKKQFSGVEKLAHRVVDTEHPIIKSCSAMIMSGEELQKTAAALTDIEAELETLRTFIKESYLTKEAAGGLLGALPAVGRAVGGMVSGASKGKGMLQGLAKGAVNEFRKNPISTLGTAKSLVPQRQPAPVPPTNMNSGGM